MNNKFNILTHTRTQTLPPIDDVMKTSVNEKKTNSALIVLSEEERNRKRLELLNNLKCAEDNGVVNTSYTDISQETNISPSSIGNDVIMLQNIEELSDTHRKVYNLIIGAFKAKKLSDSSIYCILQSIPYIDIIEDVVVIYTKRMEIFNEIEVPCVNIATALREGFKDKDLKIKFIPCKVKTIADYFSRVNWNRKIH